MVSLGLSYETRDFHPLFSLVDHISLLSPVRFERIRTLSAFFLALLAALGLNELLERRRRCCCATPSWRARSRSPAVTTYLAADSLSSGYRNSLLAQRQPTLSPQIVSTLVHQRHETSAGRRFFCSSPSVSRW